MQPTRLKQNSLFVVGTDTDTDMNVMWHTWCIYVHKKDVYECVVYGYVSAYKYGYGYECYVVFIHVCLAYRYAYGLSLYAHMHSIHICMSYTYGCDVSAGTNVYVGRSRTNLPTGVLTGGGSLNRIFWVWQGGGSREKVLSVGWREPGCAIAHILCLSDSLSLSSPLCIRVYSIWVKIKTQRERERDLSVCM